METLYEEGQNYRIIHHEETDFYSVKGKRSVLLITKENILDLKENPRLRQALIEKILF